MDGRPPQQLQEVSEKTRFLTGFLTHNAPAVAQIEMTMKAPFVKMVSFASGEAPVVSGSAGSFSNLRTGAELSARYDRSGSPKLTPSSTSTVLPQFLFDSSGVFLRLCESSLHLASVNYTPSFSKEDLSSHLQFSNLCHRVSLPNQ